MYAKCIKVHQFGKPEEVLQVEDKRVIPPAMGEVLVRMKLSPINPSDLIPIRGSYSHRISLPMIPGYEGVGIVEEVGPSVSQQLIGKRVLPLRGEGTWQEVVKAPAEFVVPIPQSIEDHVAAQLYINPITAWVVCTEILALKPDDVLIVNASGSALGRLFAQVSTILGFRMIAVTRNSRHTEELLELGASHVIDTSNAPLHQTVMELTNGHGVTAAIDSIGGLDGTELAFCVQPNGYFLTIGLLSGIQVNWKKISQRSTVHIKLFHLRNWNQQVSAQNWQVTFQRIITLIRERRLTLPSPHSYYHLIEAQKAVHAAERTGRNGSKVFLRMGGETSSC